MGRKRSDQVGRDGGPLQKTLTVVPPQAILMLALPISDYVCSLGAGCCLETHACKNCICALYVHLLAQQRDGMPENQALCADYPGWVEEPFGTWVAQFRDTASLTFYFICIMPMNQIIA